MDPSSGSGSCLKNSVQANSTLHTTGSNPGYTRNFLFSPAGKTLTNWLKINLSAISNFMRQIPAKPGGGGKGYQLNPENWDSTYCQHLLATQYSFSAIGINWISRQEFDGERLQRICRVVRTRQFHSVKWPAALPRGLFEKITSGNLVGTGQLHRRR